jgi:RNA polymerase primary sigma factor
MRQLKISQTITNRENQSLEKYLTEVSKQKLITVDEEIELTQRIRSGDHEALDKMTRANLRFVVSVAKQYQHQGLPLTDLINEGNLGLIKAAQKFDETKGFKFISYAVWWIRQSIVQAIAEHSRVVRIPLNKVADISKVSKALSSLEQKLERLPTESEISEIIELSQTKIKDTISVMNRNHLSMDAPLTSDDDNSGNMYDVFTSNPEQTDSELMKESMRSTISRVVSKLDERSRQVIVLYFGLNGNREHTLDEISYKIKLTRERVRQIKEKALRTLRGMSKRRPELKSYI